MKALTDSLASANTESEYFREQWTELKLRDEALGVEALTVDESKLEDKHVQAVKELYQEVMKRREALVLLDKLLTSTDKMLQTAPNYDPKVQGRLLMKLPPAARRPTWPGTVARQFRSGQFAGRWTNIPIPQSGPESR